MNNNSVLEQESKECVDSKQLTENEYFRNIKNSQIFKFLSNDTANKITLATTAVALGSFFVRVLAYLNCKGYLSVFSISISQVDFSVNEGFSKLLVYAVSFIGLMMGTAFAYLAVDHFYFTNRLRKAANTTLKLNVWKKVGSFLHHAISFAPVWFVSISFQICFNFLLCIFLLSPKTDSQAEIKDWIIPVAFLMISETVVAYVLCVVNTKKNKKAKKKEDNEQRKKERAVEELAEKVMQGMKRKTPVILDLAMSGVAITIFAYSVMAYWGGVLEAKQTKQFSIIDEKYAVIYQTSERFWTVACMEENGILTLDTTKQKIISSIDVEAQKKEFSNVTINYECN